MYYIRYKQVYVAGIHKGEWFRDGMWITVRVCFCLRYFDWYIDIVEFRR